MGHQVFVLLHENTTKEIGDHEKNIYVVENDPFTLVCGANKYDYEPVIFKHKAPGECCSIFSHLESSKVE